MLADFRLKQNFFVADAIRADAKAPHTAGKSRQATKLPFQQIKLSIRPDIGTCRQSGCWSKLAAAGSSRLMMMICAPAAWKLVLAGRLQDVFGNMTTREIADATGHNRETVRRFLASGSPSVAFLVDTSRASGVSVDWLLGLRSAKH